MSAIVEQKFKCQYGNNCAARSEFVRQAIVAIDGLPDSYRVATDAQHLLDNNKFTRRSIY